MSTERPILFSDHMVRAILSGAKTQTRRIVTTREPLTFIGGSGDDRDDPSNWGWFFDDREGHGWSVLGRGHTWRNDNDRASIRCPYGRVGDRLWVREAWRLRGWGEDERATVEYRADGAHRVCEVLTDSYEDWLCGEQSHLEAQGATMVDDPERGPVLRLPEGKQPHWRPSIFMRRWACRLVLEVTDVRVERLQKITEADARAEGVVPYTTNTLRMSDPNAKGPLYLPAFEELWDSINGDRESWSSNPWVWVVTFKRASERAGGSK